MLAYLYPSRLRFRLDCGSIFALTLSPKAPTVGGTPRHHPDMTCRFASSEQKYTSHSIPKSQTRRVYRWWKCLWFGDELSHVNVSWRDG